MNMHGLNAVVVGSDGMTSWALERLADAGWAVARAEGGCLAFDDGDIPDLVVVSIATTEVAPGVVGERLGDPWPTAGVLFVAEGDAARSWIDLPPGSIVVHGRSNDFLAAVRIILQRRSRRGQRAVSASSVTAR